jgi:hypothetical protein
VPGHAQGIQVSRLAQVVRLSSLAVGRFRVSCRHCCRETADRTFLPYGPVVNWYWEQFQVSFGRRNRSSRSTGNRRKLKDRDVGTPVFPAVVRCWPSGLPGAAGVMGTAVLKNSNSAAAATAVRPASGRWILNL